MSVTIQKATKPLGHKAYGHIPHLPGSRMGPADHHCHEGQARICTVKPRDKHDFIVVEEKLDGSCVSVARIDGQIIALGRSGYPAKSSPYVQHHMFADWVETQTDRFLAVLNDGERLVGEWLAQAHGTRYKLWHEPFVVFDIMRGPERLTWAERGARLTSSAWFETPGTISFGKPFSIKQALDYLERMGSYHGAIDPVEGAVWRVERHGKVDFLAKFVRPDKVDGCYLPEISGQPEVWNWRPESGALQ